jgi:hypothetical protein
MEPEALYEKNHNGVLFTTSNEYIFDFHAWVKKCQNGTFLPMHENQKKFGPNVFICCGKQ